MLLANPESMDSLDYRVPMDTLVHLERRDCWVFLASRAETEIWVSPDLPDQWETPFLVSQEAPEVVG